MTKGIDVSVYQGKIDWHRVKPYIDFAIIRCGYGDDVVSQDDAYYERNTKECEKLHIPYGVYLYSLATTIDEAQSEVAHVLRLVRGKKLNYPIFLDVESRRQMALPKDELIAIVKYFCEEIERAGYYVGIYSSLNRFRDNLDSQELDAFDKWVAEWNDELTYKGAAGMWQYTSFAELAGIKGRVDGDMALLDYPKIIKDAGLNHLDDAKDLHVGDSVIVSGPIYTSALAQEEITSVCEEEFILIGITDNAVAPYQICDGFVKPENIKKVAND